MSLTGSLETFSLPDVLALLASSAKTGELSVDGGSLRGRLWVEKGQLVNHDVVRAKGLIDAVFELLRMSSGSFAFEADVAGPEGGERAKMAGVLEAAQQRLVEWRSIEKVVPSLDAAVRMAPVAPGAEVTVRDDQWRLLVTAGSGCSVASMMEEAGLGEFDCCKAIKELVEARLVEIAAPADLKPAPRVQSRRAERVRSGARTSGAADAGAQGGQEVNDVPASAPDPAPRPPADLDALVEIPQRLRGHTSPAPSNEPGAAAAAAEPAVNGAKGEPGPDELAGALNDEPINRGLLLKFLSSVRS